ncbi:MAG: hypothetical protein M3Y42_01445 [Actinomycetota bacterium]|nr:hypothetical protein [Actinomycetota bacterium]MDQ2955612.1 hypothetical protein [Actinomycetota bacterium]
MPDFLPKGLDRDLGLLTPTLYQKLTPFERHLANRSFNYYRDLLRRGEPSAYGKTIPQAAKRAYTRAMMVPVNLGLGIGIVGASFISLAGGQPVLVGCGVFILLCDALQITFFGRRAIQIGKYFRTEYLADPIDVDTGSEGPVAGPSGSNI